MNILKIVRKNRNNIIIFFTVLIISLIIFKEWLPGHYATDTYDVINKGYSGYSIINSLKDGRIFMNLIMQIASILNLDIIVLEQATLILAIIICSISIVYLKSLAMRFIKEKKLLKEVLLTIASFVVIFNFMFLENMYYLECLVMALGILTSIISAKVLILDEKNNVIKSLLLMILSVAFYQGTTNFYVTLVVFLACIKHEKEDNVIIKKFLQGGVVWAVSMLTNYVLINSLQDLINIHSYRTGNIQNICYNFLYIIKNIPNMIINTNFYFPKYLFILNIVILLALGIYYFFKTKEKYKIGYIILLCFCAYFSCFAISLVTLASFGSARMMFSLGALIGLLVMYYLVNSNNKDLFFIICIGILIIYTGITTYEYIDKTNKQVEINKKDIEHVQNVEKIIKKYESESGRKINYIAFCKDKFSDVTYRNLYSTALEDSSIEPTWSRLGLVNYWTNRNLTEIKMDEEIYKQYFKDKDWNEFSEEQIVFIDETMYYCIY